MVGAPVDDSNPHSETDNESGSSGNEDLARGA